MRNNEMLEKIKEVATLNQFLYMDKDNFVEYNQDDGTTLEFRLDEDLDYIYNYAKYCGALADLAPKVVTDSMNLTVLIGIVEGIKMQKPKDNRFKNRWEEIESIVLNG